MLKPPHIFEIPPDTEKDTAETFAAVNEALQRLSASRVERITVSGNLARSKIAWKVATYRQALLYRVVALGSGSALCWNDKNFLSSLIIARALVETVALLLDFENRIARHLSQEDLDGIDKLSMNRRFGSRDADWVKAHPDDAAINVLTLIKKLDREPDFNGMLGHYEGPLRTMSPQLARHSRLVCNSNTSVGTETYSEHKLQCKLSKLFGGVFLIVLAEHAFNRIDAQVNEIAEIQHRINPIGGE